MFESPKWQKGALALNLGGAILLFLSFQATPSNIKIITTEDHRTALCVDGRSILTAFPDGGIAMGSPICPDWNLARPAAVVNVEKPFMVTLGFLLMCAGFLLQYFAVPDPKTIENMRKELNALRRSRKKH